jgi:hypothetical protein
VLRREWIGSPNYSSRGSGVRLVVLHTAEGALTYQSLGSFFSSPSSGVSSHTGIDDTPGVIGEYVRREHKAWTQGNANPYSVAAELCAFASWSPGEWARHPVMLENTAQWVAEECAHFGIPLRKLSPGEAQGSSAMGVCQHADLGAAGGGHWDCGPSFPIDDVLRMAAGTAAAPAPTEEEGNMIATTPGGAGYFTTTRDGAVYAFGDAVFRGAANTGDLPAGRKIVGIAAAAKDGYYLLSDGGDLYTYGSAQYYGKPDRV